MRLLDETTTLKLDGHTVRLRPTLRCALKISEAHGEPVEFCGKILKNNVSLIGDLFAYGIEDDDERRDALAWLAYSPQPLRKRVEHVALDLYIFALHLTGIDPDEKPSTSNASGPAMKFNRTLGELFGFATGILHWAPESAWNATPREIAHAMHVWRRTQPGYEPTDDERAEEALSATFDRVGLQALKNLA
ncbi:phage tail assembly chaperone [Xanthobacter autotrophicus]|uniref:phage tail assembly chaperone n=1 Tax=Xanthobacter autotrophicus TaxID=280 RepID=UPI00372C9568